MEVEFDCVSHIAAFIYIMYTLMCQNKSMQNAKFPSLFPTLKGCQRVRGESKYGGVSGGFFGTQTRRN